MARQVQVAEFPQKFFMLFDDNTERAISARHATILTPIVNHLHLWHSNRFACILLLRRIMQTESWRQYCKRTRGRAQADLDEGMGGMEAKSREIFEAGGQFRRFEKKQFALYYICQACQSRLTQSILNSMEAAEHECDALWRQVTCLTTDCRLQGSHGLTPAITLQWVFFWQQGWQIIFCISCMQN